jgi:hypothetical protein
MTTPDDTTKRTLEAIEHMLICERASPHEAVLAAYKLGKLDGMIEMAKVGEKALQSVQVYQ